MKKDELQKLATKFNEIMITIRDSGGFSKGGEFSDDRTMFDQYPHGCCQEASEIFGRYLEDENFVSMSDVKKYRGTYLSLLERVHYWLEIGGITVDLTCGQFDEEDEIDCDLECPFVNETSSWHTNYWNKELKGNEWPRDFEELYETIRKKLSQKDE